MGIFGSKPSLSRKGLRKFYELSATTGKGKEIQMEKFRGKVVFAINVASK